MSVSDSIWIESKHCNLICIKQSIFRIQKVPRGRTTMLICRFILFFLNIRSRTVGLNEMKYECLLSSSYLFLITTTKVNRLYIFGEVNNFSTQILFVASLVLCDSLLHQEVLLARGEVLPISDIDSVCVVVRPQRIRIARGCTPGIHWLLTF